jgi:hypothetical protein
MDFLNTANEVIVLITGLLGLVSSMVSVFFLIRSFLKNMKNNTLSENWKLIMKIADAAMIEAEASMKSGEEKKQIVMDSVKEGCKAAGINIDAFIDQLDAYIEECIKFAKGLNNAK